MVVCNIGIFLQVSAIEFYAAFVTLWYFFLKVHRGDLKFGNFKMSELQNSFGEHQDGFVGLWKKICAL